MKKFAAGIAAVVLAAAMLFSFSGCGTTPEEQLKSYIEGDTFQSQLSTLKDSVGTTMDIDVKAEGSKLIMTFVYNQDIPEGTLDTVKAALETAMSSISSSFESIANSLKNDLGISDASIVVELNANDGTSLFSQTYTPTE